MRMKKSDEWIKSYDSLKIAGLMYYFRCTWCTPKKAVNSVSPAFELQLQVYKEGEGWMVWNDFKKTYIAEKISDYVKNTINGQRTPYWESDGKKVFK